MQGIDPVNAPPDADDAWILVQDLRKVVGESGRLEKDLNTTNRGIVIGPALVQVVAISNISQPSYNQNGSPKMLYVTFTDGATKCRGVVLNPISGITLHTPPGSKCLLVNCQVWRGCLMLDQKTCTFLGGKVNSLINSWKDQQERMLQKDIAVAAGLKFTTRRGDDKPPPFENFKQGQTKRVKKQLPKQEVQKKACSSFKQLGKSQNRVSGRLDDIRVDESELILEISDLSNSKQCLPAGTQLKSMLLHGAPTGALLDARLDKLGKAFKQKLLIFDVDPDTKSIHNIEQSRAPPPAPVHKDLSAEAKEFVPPGAKGPKGTRGGGGGSNERKDEGVAVVPADREDEDEVEAVVLMPAAQPKDREIPAARPEDEAEAVVLMPAAQPKDREIPAAHPEGVGVPARPPEGRARGDEEVPACEDEEVAVAQANRKDG
eukprot:CAMPEP_0203746128 /NCGR_PEP_ID=MMETSP0098-20131031/1657_1 /ASSEMBLY_ACC=CAM_ASM_000208 /TAXON_ID=96639 /ORGANISM=" , Strain NY0313808BC1" /LENGTH=431 /DNA_ID=CAMNT_0050634109 /DNA_START=575 /DNA_END=1868 /DNA_ORIENTATION=+